MATSTPKVELNASRDIPFNKLVLSQANVRQIKAGLSVEDLSLDIARRGLLQSLNVRPVRDAQGVETGLYEVPAGGRRYRALELLVKSKRLAKTAPVPCTVQAHETAAEEDSLAENIQRVSPHPLDQFRAFRTLREERGMSEEEIAAAFFITPAVVKQRLRLTAVSPKLLDLYAEDAMSLEQLMAFTVSGDHARQEQVWEAIQRGYNKEPYLIRRMLTEGKVSASDRRAVFVGAPDYELAGGTIARDLFQQDGGGWFEDVPLLERLVDERLQAEAATIVAEGWKWVEVARDFPWGHTQGLRRVFATVEPLTAAEEEQLASLREELERIEEQHNGTGEDLPEEVDARLAELEAAIQALEERPGTYDPTDIVIGGAYVSLSHEGRIRVERGYVRPEDEPAVEEVSGSSSDETDGMADGAGTVQRAVITVGGSDGSAAAANADEEDGEAGRPLSERLVTELTAFRTLSLREALANDPDVAFLAVLHALALKAFYGQQAYDPASCLEIEAKSSPLPSGGGVTLAETAAARALGQQHEAWGVQLPKRPGEVWDWLLTCDPDTRLALFAYCAARTVNATIQPYDRRPSALQHATRLAQALPLDLSTQWEPTEGTYLGRVTKAQILDAVREAKGEAASQLIDHLKKADMAREAERLLRGTGWLPVILRTPAQGGAGAGTPVEDGPEVEALPAFLDEPEDATAAGSASYAVAAE